MRYGTLQLRVEDAIGRLTFNRPSVLNAFDPILIAETREALAGLVDDPAVGAIIVHGAGRAFLPGSTSRPQPKPESAALINAARCSKRISTSSCSSGTALSHHRSGARLLRRRCIRAHARLRHDRGR